MRINYIDAICGAGKTEAAIRHVIRMVNTRHQKFVLMMPTIRLIEQTEKRFQALGYKGPLTAIHGDNGDAIVSKRIHAFFDQSEASGVLLITVDAWRWVKGRCVNDWHLIVDECPAVFRVSSIQSKSIRDRILPHLGVSPHEASSHPVVSIRKGSGTAIKRLLDESRTDAAMACLRSTLERLYLGDKTYVTAKNFEAFSAGNADSVTLYHVMPPSVFRGFKSVTMMGANFTHSEVYQLWSRWGVRFERRDGFRGQSPLPSLHSEAIGKQLDIYYLCEDFSAAFKGKHKETLEAEFRRAVIEVFEGKEFIYTINGADDPYVLEGVPNGKFVKPKAHGQNSYRHIDCAAIFAHFNLSTDQAGFLRSVFDSDWMTLWDLRNLDIYYQFVCRTSLREEPSAFSDVTPKKIIVMDKGMALWLKSLFPGSRVHEFASEAIKALPVPLVGRPKKSSALSGAERAKKSRAKKKAFGDVRKLMILKGQWINEAQKSHESRNGNTLIRESVTRVTEEKKWPVSSVGGYYTKDVATIYVVGFGGLVDMLREAHERELQLKEDNQLFNVTEFISEAGLPRGRKLTDVRYSHAILMDMDSKDKDCCPFEFASALSGLEMVIYSTFSSTVERKRWRVVLPLSRPVSEKEYRSIASDLIRLAEDMGFPFDHSKKRANDFMYLPCHSTDRVASFFRHFNGEGRCLLDVDGWLRS